MWFIYQFTLWLQFVFLEKRKFQFIRDLWCLWYAQTDYDGLSTMHQDPQIRILDPINYFQSHSKAHPLVQQSWHYQDYYFKNYFLLFMVKIVVNLNWAQWHQLDPFAEYYNYRLSSHHFIIQSTDLRYRLHLSLERLCYRSHHHCNLLSQYIRMTKYHLGIHLCLSSYCPLEVHHCDPHRRKMILLHQVLHRIRLLSSEILEYLL
jgi:hypothetical protein